LRLTSTAFDHAAVDYSFVKEPDYNPAALRQDPEVTAYIERLVPALYDQWRQRGSLKASSDIGTFERRSRSIYYDTDNIHEEQIESVRICDDCGGVVTIDSMASTGNRIFAVIVPGRACAACRREGEALFAATKSGDVYRYVYLQDRDRDVFTRK